MSFYPNLPKLPQNVNLDGKNQSLRKNCLKLCATIKFYLFSSRKIPANVQNMIWFLRLFFMGFGLIHMPLNWDFSLFVKHPLFIGSWSFKKSQIFRGKTKLKQICEQLFSITLTLSIIEYTLYDDSESLEKSAFYNFLLGRIESKICMTLWALIGTKDSVRFHFSLNYYCFSSQLLPSQHWLPKLHNGDESAELGRKKMTRS